MTAVAATPTKPNRTEIWGILPDKKKVPQRWPVCLRKQPPRVRFKNNDIYMVNNEESDTYEEPKERHPRVMYKLKVSEDPPSKNMPHEEEFDEDFMNLWMKQQYKNPPVLASKVSVYCI